MKRDLDLVRTILKEIESKAAGDFARGLSIDGRAQAEVDEHVRIMIDAGLLDGQPKTMAAAGYHPTFIRGLSWHGHDFLDAARDDSIWKKVREKIVKAAGSMAFDVVVELLKAEGKSRLGLPG